MKRIKTIFLSMAVVGLLLGTGITGCGGKKTDSESEKTEHPSEGSEHPNEGESKEHPSEHPSN
ncbi:hypothetical protein [Lunatimonas lonarensis]|nr:hypothetical protein [Lunatimonas lonarensis]